MEYDLGSVKATSTWITTSIVTLTLTYVSCRQPKEEHSDEHEEPQSILPVKKPADSAKMQKTIYLTFDDGPNTGTPTVLDILEQEQLPATMFLIGEHVTDTKRQHETYLRITKNPLLEIANHSYTHGFHNRFNAYYTQPVKVIEDFKKCADSLGLTSNIVRTPGRNIWRLNDIALTDIKSSKMAGDSLKAKGYKVIGWDLEWRFTGTLKLIHSATQMAAFVDTMFMKEKLRSPNNLVFLMHDKTFMDAQDSTELRNFIRLLKQEDKYNFSVLSNYPGVKITTQ